MNLRFLLPAVGAALLLSTEATAQEAAPPAKAPELKNAVALFDGKSFDGWEGSREWFRIEEGAVVGGGTDRKIPRNEFLTTTKEFADFELRLQFKLVGEKTNAGIQVRSRRIPNHHEMIGYQADLGPGYFGALYDESRRKKVLQGPKAEEIAKFYKPGEWNDYRIRCEGRRIQLWINDHATVDYTEEDASLEQKGLVGLQIHSGPPGEAWYRDVRIEELK